MTPRRRGARSDLPPLAVTMGEPAGIGGEIALKAWLRRREGIPPFFAIDDPRRLETVSKTLDLEVPIRLIAKPTEADTTFAEAFPVIPLRLAEESVPGRLSAANQSLVRASIEQAVGFAMAGETGGIVTNPIHKHALYGSGFSYPGHTEFLAALAGVARSVMMLACPHLRVVPVTIHVSLLDAIGSLNTRDIVETARIAARSLERDFGIRRPRLAIAGLNPHAGEGGTMGMEDALIVKPAVDALRDLGLEAFGPLPPDTMFSDRARAGYDVAICMYHDQALIPIKALDFDGGVNVTLGLPFVRTSPDHGTALDIAGTGQASEASLIAALRLAARISAPRSATASVG